MLSFYAGLGIAAHRTFGFGEDRLFRLMTDVRDAMAEEITTDDLIARCARETGLNVVEDEFDN